MDVKTIAQKAKDALETPNGKLATTVAVTVVAIAGAAVVIKAINDNQK